MIGLKYTLTVKKNNQQYLGTTNKIHDEIVTVKSQLK